ncbi:hypothetical protein [Bacteriovorax sp. Seq25_V]|uniref:hypothetical protein n=1 Tax=Bacteriovorax sp. Seq25_V TaxID=1201288 RepID=UPI00038A4CB9|nr:hypothetical protein [Bacteriovorax sp. Seq25_V]EQC45997.1 hypothetical protein M900_1829 [Bacteriovorax sp. Seq25_V]
MGKKKFIVKFSAFFLGCYCCVLLREYFGLNAVISSCLVGLFGTFLPVQKFGNKSRIEAAIYAGSFAGMCSAGVLSGALQIFLLSILGGTFFLLTENILHGLGGKLGTIAFISVSLVYLIKGIM